MSEPTVTNWAQMQFLLNLSNYALTLVIGLYAWYTRRDRATHDRITSVEARLGARCDALAIDLANGDAAARAASATRIDAVETALVRRIAEVEQGNHARIDGHRARLDQLLDRTARVEERISALPSAAALATVEGDVHAVRESVEGMETQMRGLAAQLQLVNQHLLDRSAPTSPGSPSRGW